MRIIGGEESTVYPIRSLRFLNYHIDPICANDPSVAWVLSRSIFTVVNMNPGGEAVGSDTPVVKSFLFNYLPIHLLT